MYPVSYPSLCIPKVDLSISRAFIEQAFNQLGWGTLKQIDIIMIHKDPEHLYKRVFIHFNEWKNDYEAQLARNRFLEKDGVIHVVYDAPRYWKIYASRSDRGGHDMVEQTTVKGTCAISL